MSVDITYDMYDVFLFLTLLSVIVSRSIRVAKKDKFISFFYAEYYSIIYTPHFLLFIS